MKTPLLFLFIVLTCYSCCPKEYDELNKDELSWLPYEVGDTLYFKSNLGNIDKWVVTKKEVKELNYGQGHTKCAKTYYNALYVNLFNFKDSVYYRFSVAREMHNGKARVSIMSTTLGDSPVFYNLPNTDTLQIQGGSYLESITRVNFYLLKKGIGIYSYDTKKSLEVYENI